MAGNLPGCALGFISLVCPFNSCSSIPNVTFYFEWILQELVGPVPEGYDGYFRSRFPKLLIEVYKVVYIFCREEDCFHKYF